MNDSKDMPLINHLEELRWAILKSLASVIVMSILTFNFANYLVDLLIAPAGKISQEMSLQVLTIQGMFMLKWNLLAGIKIGLANFSEYVSSNYIALSTDVNYKIPFQYKRVSTSFFVSPQLMQSISGETSQSIMLWNAGVRVHLNF